MRVDHFKFKKHVRGESVLFVRSAVCGAQIGQFGHDLNQKPVKLGILMYY